MPSRMHIYMDELYVILGFTLLILGAEGFVQGAVSLASKFRVSPLLIGFTIVSSITLDVVSHFITIFLAKYLIKSQAEEMDVKEIMDGLLQEGRTIKDKGTGIYFKVVGSKLQTSYPIHTEAGGDPDVYWAWEKAQEGSDTYPPED